MILLILLLLSRLVLLAHEFCLIPNINYHSFMFFFKNMYISVINQTVISVLTKYYDSDITFAARVCLFGFPEVNGT